MNENAARTAAFTREREEEIAAALLAGLGVGGEAQWG